MLLTRLWPQTKVTNLGKRSARVDGLVRSKTLQIQGPKVPREAELFRPLERHLRTNVTKRAVRTPPGVTLGLLLPTGMAGEVGGVAEIGRAHV